MRKVLLALATILIGAPAAAQAQQRVWPVDYSNDANWLCRPGRQDPCGRPLPTALLNSSEPLFRSF